MENRRPLIGITMGDPVGVGPEIIFYACGDPSIYETCRPLVIGDIGILSSAKPCTGSHLNLHSVSRPGDGKYRHGFIDVMNMTHLDTQHIRFGIPTPSTGHAMVSYITTAIQLAIQKQIDAMVTCPINKSVLKMAGYSYHGHTELLAEQTQSENIAMMFAGDRFRVVLVTIHEPLNRVAELLSIERIINVISITHDGLVNRFGIRNPLIAVAGLNPHAGEKGLFGHEEDLFILPAIEYSRQSGKRIVGPFPPDTLFYHAAKGNYDAVICMYHDQGLIPFKMIHFDTGVNVTLGLPIIRTSVDHGTAYDIAGTGKAHPGSLIAAIKMAALQACHLMKTP